MPDLPQEQHEIILRDSVLSIEREKLEQMSLLPPDQREKFLLEQFSDLASEQREKWLQIASLTYEERDKIFRESFTDMSTLQKQQMIREQYSALKVEDRERLFKENFPELPVEQRQKFEKALLADWKGKEEKWDLDKTVGGNEDEIFNMDNINEDEPRPTMSAPKSFIACTSTDRIRKISVVNNDFRPIIDEPQVNANEKSNEKSNVSLAKKNCKDDLVEEAKSVTSSKKKRKRKSVMKRKGSQRKASNGSSSQTETSETDFVPTEEQQNEHPEFYVHSFVNSANRPVDLSGSRDNGLKSTEGPSPVPEVEIPTAENLAGNSSGLPDVNHSAIDYHFFSDTEVTK